LLADRLLELASLEKRRTLDDVHAVSLQAIVHDAAAAMEPAARRKDVTVQTNAATDILVEGDSFLLLQAVINLLANAIDFSSQGETVEVSLSTDGRQVEVAVRDRGSGIPDYALDRIFEKFYSLRRPDTGKKGTGLGLAFVREIAHLHGGEAQLGNHAQGGALATLVLPAMKPRK
jgi:two-component system, OmpR family, sensor histidine kinase CreC